MHKVEWSDGEMRYYLGGLPATSSRGLLVLVHGYSRSYERLAAAFDEPARALGFTVLAPVFDEDKYRHFQLLAGRAEATVIGLAAAEALRAACSDAARRLKVLPSPIRLFGFSGGAQFSHRYAMAYPDQVAALVVAAAGWYTMPDPSTPFPLGCAASEELPRGMTDLDSFLRIPVHVMVGENDTLQDSRLRLSGGLKASQGPNRLERARRWTESVAQAATERGIEPRVSFELLPDCGHSLSQALERGGLAERALAFFARESRGLMGERTVE